MTPLFFLLGALGLAGAQVSTAPLPDRRLPRAILIFADGLGWGHAEEGDLGTLFTRAGSLYSPDVDAAGIASRVATGCDRAADAAVSSLDRREKTSATGAMPLVTEAFAHKGAKVGVVTTKCLDDGSTSPFIARWGDRYDLRGVAAEIKSADLAYAAGGYSNELRGLQRLAKQPFVFTSAGDSVYARRCEYATRWNFKADAMSAFENLAPRGDFLLVLVYTEVDRASHGRDRTELRRALSELRDTVAALSEAANSSVPLVMFGAHDTGGYEKSAGFRIIGHAPADTPVPVFVEAGLPSLFKPAPSARPALGTLASATRHHATVYHHGHAHAHAEEEIFAVLFVFFLFLVLCLCCLSDQPLVGTANINRRDATLKANKFMYEVWTGRC